MKVDVRKEARKDRLDLNKYRLIKQNIEGFKDIFSYQKYMLSRILWLSKDSEVRIVPGNNGTELYPQVINATNWSTDSLLTDFVSDTFYITQTLSNFGDARLDICSNLDPDSEEATQFEISPLNYFCNKIHSVMRAVNNGKKPKVRYNENWKLWTGMKGKLTFPKTTLFFQAICNKVSGVVCHSDEAGQEENPLYGLIGINHTASIQALLEALVLPMDRRKPIGTDNNNFGALAEANGNMLFLNSIRDEKDRLMLQPSIQEAGTPASEWNPTEYNLPEAVCKTLWVPWKNLLNYLTVKDQLELIAREFGADTLNYVFSLEPDLWSGLVIPDRIKAVGMGSYEATKADLPAHKKPVLMRRSTAPVTQEMQESESNDIESSINTRNGINMAAMRESMQKLVNARKPSRAAAVANDLLDDIDDDDLAELPEDIGL